VALRSDDGEVGRPTLAVGSGLTVAIQVDATTRLVDWILGVGLTTPMGTTLYQTNTKLMGVPPLPLLGTGRYEFHLADLPLGEGDYAVQASIQLLDGTDVHLVPEAAVFSVRGDGSSLGPLSVPITFAMV